MTTNVERLVVSLEASITKYERAMQRALGQTNQTARRIESRFARMNRGLGSSFVALQRNIAMAFAGVAATRGATQLIDSATRIENALKVTGLAGEDLERVYQRLYDSAQRNLAPVDTLVDLYSRLGLAQKELGVTQDQMTDFADRVALALRVQGTTAEEARGALIQLSQAMGEGVFRAQEFNSIIEQAPSIHRAAAAGLKEANGSVAALRQIMLEGRLSSRAYFDALLAGSHILEDQVANAEVTVSQGFVRLQNVLVDTARGMNENSRISGVLVGGLSDLGVVIQEVAAFAEYAVGPITDMANALRAVNEFLARGAAVNGLDRFGASAATWINDLAIPGLSAGSSRAGNVVKGTFELLGATPQDEALAAILAGEQDPAPAEIVVKPQVSIADYPIGPADSAGGSTAGGGVSGYQRALEAQRERLRQMEMETALQRTLNPLVNDYGYAVEKLRAQMELENAAAKEGLAITPKRRAEIEQLSEQYATAAANADRLAEAQHQVREAAEAMGEAARDALDTIVQGFIDGKDAGEIFGQVLRQLGSTLINMGFSQFGSTFKVPGFAGGTRNAPGGLALVGERGPELVNLPQGAQVIPNHRTNQLLAGAGPTITYAPQIDARGADVAAVARLERVIARDRAEFEGRVRRIVSRRGKDMW